MTHGVLGRALLVAGRPADAVPELLTCITLLPDYAPIFHSLVVAAVETDQMDLARSALGEISRIQPGWTPELSKSPWLLRHDTDRRRFMEAFRTASAPELVCGAVVGIVGPAVPSPGTTGDPA
jgi:hypothetical protein